MKKFFVRVYSELQVLLVVAFITAMLYNALLLTAYFTDRLHILGF